MKWYKKIALLLAGVMCFGVAACGSKTNQTTDPSNPNNPDNPQTTKPVNPVRDPDQHYIEGGLHKVSVTESSRPFIADGATEYEIIVGSDQAQLNEANAFLRKYIEKATGVTMNFEYYDESITYDANSKYIVIGCPELFASAGLTMPADDIGQTGYYVKSAGNSVFLQTKGVFGYQNAVIAFLRHVLGYEIYSAEIVTFSKSGATLPDLDITEKPDFEFRIQGNPVGYDARYGMGFMTTGDIFIPIDGLTQHNTFAFLPPNMYKASHPYWYSTTNDQLCYTAHGDESEFDQMVDTVYKRMMQLLADKPNVANITFTQEDVRSQCACSACQKIMTDYGTISASMIQFCNAVSRKVQADLQAQADKNGTEKREFNIMFFAYQRSEKPPATKDANGVWHPIDETVVCDENVGVYIAPIDAFYNKSFYNDENASAANNIDGWAACSQKLYMWLYETNYHYYFYPINTYDTMVETYRFCFERGAIYMMNEGQWDQPNVTHFSKLKEYFNGKAEFDVNVNFNEVANDFFANYFKEAAAPMRQFFDELQAQLRWIEATYPADVPGGIYNNMEQERFWPKKMLDHWLDLCDEAYAAIEPYRARDPELYAALRKNILLETIFPRYALIRLYPGRYDAGELREMQLSFKRDAQSLDIRRYRENTSIDEIYNEWNV